MVLGIIAALYTVCSGKIQGGGEEKWGGRIASEPNNNLYFAIKSMIYNS